MSKIVIDQQAMENIQANLVLAGANIDTVANGAYVTQDMFPLSHSSLAGELNDLLGTLAQCATLMASVLRGTANFFATAIQGFSDWDYDTAKQAYELALTGTPNELPNR